MEIRKYNRLVHMENKGMQVRLVQNNKKREMDLISEVSFQLRQIHHFNCGSGKEHVRLVNITKESKYCRRLAWMK